MMDEIELHELQPHFIARKCIPFAHTCNLDGAKTPFHNEAVQERQTLVYTETHVGEFLIASGG